MCAEKSKETPIQITRLIMDRELRLTFQNAMKPVTSTITKLTACVTNKAHTGLGISTKETRNIAADAAMTLQKVLSSTPPYWSEYMRLYTSKGPHIVWLHLVTVVTFTSF